MIILFHFLPKKRFNRNVACCHSIDNAVNFEDILISKCVEKLSKIRVLEKKYDKIRQKLTEWHHVEVEHQTLSLYFFRKSYGAISHYIS